MYNCGICGHTSQPREHRRLHIVERTRPDGHMEIGQEIPVCPDCEEVLGERPLAWLMHEHRQEDEVVSAAPASRPVKGQPVFAPSRNHRRIAL